MGALCRGTGGGGGRGSVGRGWANLPGNGRRNGLRGRDGVGAKMD